MVTALALNPAGIEELSWNMYGIALLLLLHVPTIEGMWRVIVLKRNDEIASVLALLIMEALAIWVFFAVHQFLAFFVALLWIMTGIICVVERRTGFST